MSDPIEESQLPELKYADQLRLKVFLRDAAALIAAERGLNPASRMKLEALAQQQQLPDRLKQLAFGQLQAGANLDTLNRYEQAFADFLQSEFQQIPGRVLSYRAEQKAIWLAESKFQLTSLRADQLIAHQAKLAGVARLSRSDALDYAIQFLHEQLGLQESLSEEALTSLRDRLIVLGMPPTDIDSNIAYRLHFNRLQRQRLQRKRLLKRIGWTGSVGCLFFLIAAGYWKIRVRNAAQPLENDPTTAQVDLKSSSPIASNSEVQPDPTGISPPRTHSDSRAVANRDRIRQLMLQLRDTQTMDGQALELAWRNLTDEVEDPIADQMLEPIWQAFSPPSGDLFPSLERFKTQFAANLLAARLLGEPASKEIPSLPPARQHKWSTMIAAASGVSWEGQVLEDYLRNSEQQISVSQWSQLIEKTWKHPREVATMIKPLTELTLSRLPAEELQRLRSRTLKAILEAHPIQWNHLQNELKETIASADEFELTEWLHLTRRTPDLGLFEFAGGLLIDRFSQQLRPDQRLDVKTALLVIHEQIENQRWRELRLRLEQVDRHTALLLDDLNRTDRTVQAIHIETVAQLVNLRLQLAHQQLEGSIE